MSDTETAIVKPEDRTLPAIVYGLYLLGLANGLTILVGLVIAYMNRDTAGPRMRTHYTFLIRTFWLSIAWFVIAGALCLFGGVLSIILVGIPFLALGLFIFAVGGIWFAVRCVVGLVYLSQGEPYPRPKTWLI